MRGEGFMAEMLTSCVFFKCGVGVTAKTMGVGCIFRVS